MALLAVATPLVAAPRPAPPADSVRRFSDRPVAWNEHDDDDDVPVRPASNRLHDYDIAFIVRDGLLNEADRVLSLVGAQAARDVNALDEVPCSTWFCARNHLDSMTPEEVAAGPAVPAPVLPLTLIKGKDEGGSLGFRVVDYAGRHFLIKTDPAGHLGLETTGELVGTRLFHAAGYNVPGAFLLRLGPDDLRLDPHATFRLREVETRLYTWELLRAMLSRAARYPDGRVRVVAIPWIDGALGGYDLIGQRGDDPNDRIPHQDRRSLRANRLLFAWLSTMDASAINTLEAYVAEGGRHFVRHYLIDFGCSFGSATSDVAGPREGAEHNTEVGRSLRALVSLGAYHRPFQDARAQWEDLGHRYPSLGYYPAEGFDPDEFRTLLKLPTHIRMTSRDAYWGAKVVTSFTDAQLAAVVATADLPADAAAYLLHALRVRRDIIGRRYLSAVAAVEQPGVSADGSGLCFQDVAVARGHVDAASARYLIDISDGAGKLVMSTTVPARSSGTTCVPLGPEEPGVGEYRVVSLATRGAALARDGATASKACCVHLRWRRAERRFVVVGLERDE